ncbi:hypothetical protein E4U55_008119 [Claviceps digitariae]|nr:hypothetical protein E4U55_008119 [Claviceps digitariae]
MYGAGKQLGDLGARLLAACKSGSLSTVRSIAPRLYGESKPAAASFSTEIPPLRLVLAAAAEHGHADILRYLMTSMSACANIRDPWNPPLPWESWERLGYDDMVIPKAVASSNPSVVQVLLDAGMNVNHQLDRDGTPLYHAIMEGDVAMVKFLLEKGADPNDADISLRSFLAVAAREPPCDVLITLLDHGAKLPGSHALYAAAEEGNIAAAEVLLERGADVNEFMTFDLFQEKTQERTYGTPLHEAARCGKTDMVAFLLKHGANKELKDEYSETPRDIAVAFGKMDVVKILDEAE